jgi:hypothetical protein
MQILPVVGQISMIFSSCRKNLEKNDVDKGMNTFGIFKIYHFQSGIPDSLNFLWRNHAYSKLLEFERAIFSFETQMQAFDFFFLLFPLSRLFPIFMAMEFYRSALQCQFILLMIAPKEWTPRCCSSSSRSIHGVGYVDGRRRCRPSTALPVAPPGIFFFV